MSKWEYTIRSWNIDTHEGVTEAQDWLNNLGEDGYELVAVVPHKHKQALVFVLKREKPGRTGPL